MNVSSWAPRELASKKAKQSCLATAPRDRRRTSVSAGCVVFGKALQRGGAEEQTGALLSLY